MLPLIAQPSLPVRAAAASGSGPAGGSGAAADASSGASGPESGIWRCVGRSGATKRHRRCTRRGRLSTIATVVCASATVLAAAGCTRSEHTSGAPRGSCPVPPVPVVVSVEQWGDIVSSLAGDCADVTTIVRGSTGDPHEFEPTPSDIASFDGAELVVVNGLGYDTWASDAQRAASGSPSVIDAGKVAGRKLGDNPHIWYDPAVVHEVADSVTAALSERSPKAAGYFEARASDWKQSMVPYDAAVEQLRTNAAGRTYAATESVFDPMAAAIGLKDLTPAGYRKAAANESEPAAVDLAAFDSALRDRSVDVLIVNTQTQGSVPEQLRRVAGSAGVAVVDVTEAVPSGSTFVQWQLDQLHSLSTALGL